LAKALDVVGDRWTLLIVRELGVRGASRYTDLRNGLPGIATNMLVDRLREMEESGIVRREEAPPPVATTLFSLTERGEELMPVLFALGRWGASAMGERGDDEWRGYWLKYPLEELFADAAPDEPPVTLELQTDDTPLVVETVDGAIRVHPGSAEHPMSWSAATLRSSSPSSEAASICGRRSVRACASRATPRRWPGCSPKAERPAQKNLHRPVD
jgi:DNA-binding HxlR family transcriptional regulator